jgi:hypothetical protein
VINEPAYWSTVAVYQLRGKYGQAGDLYFGHEIYILGTIKPDQSAFIGSFFGHSIQVVPATGQELREILPEQITPYRQPLLKINVACVFTTTDLLRVGHGGIVHNDLVSRHFRRYLVVYPYELCTFSLHDGSATLEIAQ